MPSLIKKLKRRALPLLTDRIHLVLRFYPPYLGAGVQVKTIAPDFRYIRVEMPLTPLNTNYVGTHFGGSLYSMCDPFFMLMLIKHLGPDFIVWDKAAAIRFRRPGRGRVHAEFRLTDQEIETIRTKALRGEKVEPEFEVSVYDWKGEVVATITKTLYVRRK